MPTPNKETIYIDVDDEITAIIEKVQNSSSKILALVLPKRASVFQSVVNMKLLKRTSDQSKKSIVLITSEASLLPLAGAVGLHVAKTLQSKPGIPSAPQASDAPVSVDEDDAETLDDGSIDTAATVGELAGPPSDDEETIEVDNDDEPVVATGAGASKAAKLKKDKKLKIPDFDKFKLLLLGGIGLFIALIVFLIFANVVWPKATITIKTDTTDVTSTVSITTSPSIKDVNVDGKQVPGELKQYKKTDSTKAPATGQKDMGTKAAGTVTFTTQTNCASPVDAIAAGTTVSSGNFSFTTQEGASFTPTGISGGKCNWSTGATHVVAQSAGDSYNLSARNYSVSGVNGVTATGSVMSGGTSNIVKVVSQQDIDTAKQKLIETFNSTANQDIVGQLKSDGYFPLTDTFTTGDALVTTDPAVGSQADEVTINVSITYTMAGASQEGLKQIVEADINKHIDTTKQNILNNGIDKATIKIDTKKSSGETAFTLQTIAQAGVQQDETAIKQSVKGKKKGDAAGVIQARPGVKDVQIKTSPFWVYKIPGKDSKITLVFEGQGSASTDGQ